VTESGVPESGVTESGAGKSRTPSARNKAMDLLARREHSIAELRVKLIARDFDADEVDEAVSRLAAEGLISDDRFAEAFVTSRVRNGQGPIKIRVELERRGVSAELIVAYLERGDVDWQALACSVRVTKFGTGDAGDYREWARQARFLQQRGFSSEQIRQAVARQEDP
jgi:regulatory protein